MSKPRLELVSLVKEYGDGSVVAVDGIDPEQDRHARAAGARCGAEFGDQLAPLGGIGAFIGNVVMGLLFGWVYYRWGRSLPLIIAHWLLNIVSFVGYPLALLLWPTLFQVAP